MSRLLAAIPFPSINPVLFRVGWFSIRWYGSAYLLSFLSAHFILRRMIRYRILNPTESNLSDLMGWIVAGVLVVGRVGWWLFYHRSTGTIEPWYEPLAIWHGGMSFHGGLAGMVVGLLIRTWRKHASFWNLADCAALVVPVGLFFGRIANFINAELAGRPTMVTRGAKSWLRIREGQLAALFLILYGIIRFFVEFTRVPDPQIGFIAFGWLAMGQLLSVFAVGLGLICIHKKQASHCLIVPSLNTAFTPLLLVLTTILNGCVLAPREGDDEERALSEASAPYEQTIQDRILPDVPVDSDWRAVLHRAFLANGDLEAAYFEWAASVSRIQQAGAYPNTPVSLGFEYMFSSGNMKAWDRTTVTVGPDAMENLSFPTKTYQAAKVALSDAQAAGKRFASAKFELQRQVLTAYLDFALLAEKTRIQRENAALLKLLLDTAGNRIQAGGTQQELLRAEIDYRLSENELKAMEAELSQQRTMLNALMGRDSDAPLLPPHQLPAPREIHADDARLLAVAVNDNPELLALARQVQGRRDALELAKMQYIPDINPLAGFTGSVEQFVGVMISLPTVIPEIQGMIKEARADLRQMQAMYRQKHSDRAASFVAALYALRNSERQVTVFRQHILPRTEQVVNLARQSYVAGDGSLTDLIDTQRTLLDVRLMIAEAAITREKSLVELEALAGLDIETLAPATSPLTHAGAITTIPNHGDRSP